MTNDFVFSPAGLAQVIAHHDVNGNQLLLRGGVDGKG
eukprot:CAMPEP_0170190998 /NCGR_PEP_ID=MMETSP0040_2-20121228/50637_1 /TAXON_ID=641309 /ORGANISM="Lotharella oceanica, Strain CCMP622" /LENGTH=36 /DNA_ID= /DNA_START= /DNA_END= /DNA_ORIENTATION=